MPVAGRRRIPAPALLAVAAIAACEAPAVSPPPLADVGALRAKVSACTGVDAFAAFSFFWPEGLGGVANAAACVATARDCGELLACAGYGTVGCSVTDDRCEGGAALACVTLPSGLTAASATTCAGDPAGNDVCSIEDDAKDGRGAFCHGGRCAAEHCDGNTLVRCRGGFELRSDCGAAGMGCAEFAGQAFCAFDEPCTTDRCAGDTIEICNGGRVIVRERCQALVPGTTCVDRKGLVECLAGVPARGCAGETDYASWCESGLAVTCFGGVRIEVDCGALPGGACRDQGGNAGASAVCVASGAF